MSDLSLNSQALAGFAGTLRKLSEDVGRPVCPSAGDDALAADLSSLSRTDQACARGLNAYVTALAALAEQAATAAQALDQDLSKQLRGHHRPVADA